MSTHNGDTFDDSTLVLSDQEADELWHVAIRGCGDPGYGGCMPRCDACLAKDKLKQAGKW